MLWEDLAKRRLWTLEVCGAKTQGHVQGSGKGVWGKGEWERPRGTGGRGKSRSATGARLFIWTHLPTAHALQRLFRLILGASADQQVVRACQGCQTEIQRAKPWAHNRKGYENKGLEGRQGEQKRAEGEGGGGSPTCRPGNDAQPEKLSIEMRVRGTAQGKRLTSKRSTRSTGSSTAAPSQTPIPRSRGPRWHR